MSWMRQGWVTGATGLILRSAMTRSAPMDSGLSRSEFFMPDLAPEVLEIVAIPAVFPVKICKLRYS